MQNSELESWIKERIQEGYTPEQIESELRKEEWTKEQIEEAKQIARQEVGTATQKASEIDDNRQNFASIGRRAGANIIDSLLLFISFFTLIVLDTLVSNATGISVITRILATPLFLLMTLGYFIVSEARYGQTLGKKIFDLKVMNADDSSISYRESIIRNILRLVDWLPAMYIVGLVAMVSNEKSQRIGDQVAGTVLSQE